MTGNHFLKKRIVMKKCFVVTRPLAVNPVVDGIFLEEPPVNAMHLYMLARAAP